ncbi:MAG: hypothetical protein SGJ24_08290 [Chloroflexota bacterium]|nr:hypothetical protein [Chloroflexota bacterium]
MKSWRILAGICLSVSWWVGGAVRGQENEPAPGLIAYIGADFNLYTLALDGEAVPLTSDAGVNEDATRLRLYQMPTWAADGRLAYFASEITRDGDATLDVFVSADGVTPGAGIQRFDGNTFTYGAWAPSNCNAESDCRDLALLLSRPGVNGFVVELVRDRGSFADAETHRMIGTGSPYYFSWNPSADRMVWHRNNRRIDVYDVGTEALTELEQTPGFFSAPAWSPVDDTFLVAVQERASRESAIVMGGGSGERGLVSGLSGPVYFTWSPDGTKIAYTARQGALVVIDAANGAVLSQTSNDSVLSFFWSPDSQRLAYITPGDLSDSFDAQADPGMRIAAMAQEVGIAWSILEIDDDSITTYATFTPTQGLTYILNFFDQFAQSHSVWAPDSRHLVYSELIGAEREVIRVLDTSAPENASIIVADGSLGIWSPR